MRFDDKYVSLFQILEKNPPFISKLSITLIMDDPFRTWLIRGEFVGMQQQHVPITFFFKFGPGH